MPPSQSQRPFSAILTARRDAGADLTLVTLTPSGDHAHAYRAPGQYIQVRAAENGYFVLAGEIGAPSWELLVRMNGGASDALLRSPEGTAFEVAGPLGSGFPLERACGRHLIVAVAGSALAVTRPILRDRVARREGASTTVYVGARSPNEVALATEVAGWVDAGARVVLCLSRPQGGDGGALKNVACRRGYVQRIMSEDIASGAVTSGLVFAAGPGGMLEELKGLATTAGSLEVITNV
ncbi:MAG TPA: hypothetical protein VM580_18215 [Labilithrix sp.]|nr:hypothetical protein [Labilithrix sp.]